MKKKSKKLFIFSDTHFFSRVSKLHGKAKNDYRNRLMAEVAEADVIVMNGDIFDLFYPDNLASCATREESIRQACEEAEKWMDILLRACPGKEIYFNLGNHENVKKFWKSLKRLEEKYDGNECCKFTAKKHFLKLGSNLFFHGDLELGKKPVERRDVPKIKHLPSMKFVESLNFHLEYLGQRAMDIWNRASVICKRVLGQLEGNHKLNEKHPNILSRITKIFFGHTHIPITNHIENSHPHIGIYNTGSVTRHGRDNFLKGDIAVNDDGSYGDISNIERVNFRAPQAAAAAARAA